MGDTPSDAWTSVWCLRDYHPYRMFGELNDAFNKATDGRLLNFKEGKQDAIAAETAEFRNALQSLEFPGPVVVGLVPGHEAKESNAGCPLARVVEDLTAHDSQLVPAVDLVVRTTTISKLAKGGNRSTSVHLNSMKVSDNINLKNATILVLDDVVTTGNSMAAVRQLLIARGAKYVAGIALGQTVW